jgi:hypothetical protein
MTRVVPADAAKPRTPAGSLQTLVQLPERQRRAIGVAEDVRTAQMPDGLQRIGKCTLDRETDTGRLLKRFDQLERTQHEQGRDLQLLAETFGRYLRVWLLAHDPTLARAEPRNPPGAVRPPTASELEVRYKQFVAVM